MKIKSIHIIYLILLLSFYPDFVASQSLVTGKVIDTEGSPLPGANIIAQYGRTATTSDQNGRFSISTALIDTLLVSHIGYLDLQQAISGSISLDIILIPSVEELDEIVVIGYGIQKKRDVTGAVGSVSSQDFNVGIINSPEQLIQGRLAGVELFQNDGEPGSAFTIRIRGTSTIRAGNDPLYVIDG
ncbi:MAG: carboxypeptidase-like regulatory domain-containing protein, partial [Bacteroidia bacterium]|nr:carboxypeptidase-like regulatory domain-containing protein [Bacteroidia bacterium]